MKIPRRTFLKSTGATFTCICLAGSEVLIASEKNLEQYAADDTKLVINLNEHSKLKEVGGSETLKAGKKKIIIIHPDEKGYKAFENKCTHLGGQVAYKPKDGFMQCALHGSRFDIQGNVVKGPAEKPLTELRTSLDKDELTVYLS
jgi:cytochrome b6-f complex iron-sulfur subunit